MSKINNDLSRALASSEKFDLTPDNAPDFLTSMGRNFIQIHSKHYTLENGVWIKRYKGKSKILAARSIEAGIEILEETKSGRAIPHIVDFRGVPRFTFFQPILRDELYNGFYYSQGASSNKYSGREQHVFLTR